MYSTLERKNLLHLKPVTFKTIPKGFAIGDPVPETWITCAYDESDSAFPDDIQNVVISHIRIDHHAVFEGSSWGYINGEKPLKIMSALLYDRLV